MCLFPDEVSIPFISCLVLLIDVCLFPDVVSIPCIPCLVLLIDVCLFPDVVSPERGVDPQATGHPVPQGIQAKRQATMPDVVTLHCTSCQSTSGRLRFIAHLVNQQVVGYASSHILSINKW